MIVVGFVLFALLIAAWLTAPQAPKSRSVEAPVTGPVALPLVEAAG